MRIGCRGCRKVEEEADTVIGVKGMCYLIVITSYVKRVEDLVLRISVRIKSIVYLFSL